MLVEALTFNIPATELLLIIPVKEMFVIIVLTPPLPSLESNFKP